MNCTCIQRSSTNLSRSQMINYQEVVLYCVVHQELQQRQEIVKEKTFNAVTKNK